jgi:radical SAM superfamily enzyme YgiQ (UPF0313 family)
MRYKNVALMCLPKQDLHRPPGALAILASACEELNVPYEVYDFNLWLHRNLDASTWNNVNDNWEVVNPFDQRHTSWYQVFQKKVQEYVKFVLDAEHDLISISVFSDLSACCCVEILKEINRHPNRKNIKIVIGGTGIRAKVSGFQKDLCQELLEKQVIDFYVFGEGEISFRKILQEQTGGGINNYNVEQIEDLNQFPFPSYLKINPRDYNFIVNPEIVVTGSRGCVRKCTYCDVARYWPKYRYRTGQKIAEEIFHYWKTVGVNNFEFSDSLINGNLKQFKEMNQTLIKLQLLHPDFKPKYKGQFICRDSRSLNEKDYENMALAGCEYLYVGVESFSNNVRWAMQKKFNNDDLDWHLRICGKHGIRNSFLMLVGYPTENLSDHRKNIEWLQKNQRYAQSGIIALIVFGYTAGILEDTPLFHMQDKLNIVPEYLDADEFASNNWISLSNPDLTLKERIRRWVELTEIATNLGYLMPRNTHYIKRFIALILSMKNKKSSFRIAKIT